MTDEDLIKDAFEDKRWAELLADHPGRSSRLWANLWRALTSLIK